MSRPAAFILPELLQSRKYRRLSDELKALVFQVGRGRVNEADNGFELAFYHHDIRKYLIERAKVDAHGNECDYTYDVAHGGSSLEHDVTSFLESQQDWGNNRRHYPPITFTWRRPRWSGLGPVVPNLRFEGIIVVDFDVCPIKDFPDLPWTISSKFEGSKIEAIMRTDERIGLRDIIARMPYIRRPRATSVERMYKKLYTSNGSISNRSRKFRETAGSISWNSRDTVETRRIHRFMDARRGPYQKANNTTKGLKDLTLAEQLHFDALNFGTRDDRARADVTDAKKQAHRDKFHEKLIRAGLGDLWHHLNDEHWLIASMLRRVPPPTGQRQRRAAVQIGESDVAQIPESSNAQAGTLAGEWQPVLPAESQPDESANDIDRTFLEEDFRNPIDTSNIQGFNLFGDDNLTLDHSAVAANQPLFINPVANLPVAGLSERLNDSQHSSQGAQSFVVNADSLTPAEARAQLARYEAQYPRGTPLGDMFWDGIM